MSDAGSWVYDPEAKAGYVMVAGGDVVAWTHALRDDVLLDLDEGGRIVGVEILNVEHPL